MKAFCLSNGVEVAMTMRTGWEPDQDQEEGLASVLRRFPSHAARIQNLIRLNENFRSMCEDIAVAERALSSVDRLPVNVRDERRAEFIELVDSLAAEIEQALRSSQG